MQISENEIYVGRFLLEMENHDDRSNLDSEGKGSRAIIEIDRETETLSGTAVKSRCIFFLTPSPLRTSEHALRLVSPCIGRSRTRANIAPRFWRSAKKRKSAETRSCSCV